jgi:hypothetical protein
MRRMEFRDDGPIGLYFEDFTVGQKMVTRGRTITESDLVQFAGLTGDYNPMHTDAHFMKESQFGQRVAHGMLALSYAVGQAYQLGFMERTVVAFRGLEMDGTGRQRDEADGTARQRRGCLGDTHPQSGQEGGAVGRMDSHDCDEEVRR